MCTTPKVWRYEQPGCGADAPAPICGNSGGDACLAYVCGCDGETLTGCDYFSKPWQSRGICPGACYSPTHNLEATFHGWSGVIKGCACDPATDSGQCVGLEGSTAPHYNMVCADGTWSLDFTSPCVSLDAAPPGPGPTVDAPTVDGSARVD
jgi:hypothetical protein